MEFTTVTCSHCGKPNRVPVAAEGKPHCGNCHQWVSPALAQIATERAGRLKLVKVDVDRAPGIAQRFTVRAVPTLLLINHGQVVARQSGAASVAVLRKWLDKSLEEHNIKEAHA